MKIPNLVPQTYRSTLIALLLVSACFFVLSWAELYIRDYRGFIDLVVGGFFLLFADHTRRQHKARLNAKAQQADDDEEV